MGGLLGGSAPKPTNPKRIAAIQRQEDEYRLGKNRIDQVGAFGGSVTYDPVTGKQTTSLGQLGQDAAGGLAGLGQQYYAQAGQGVPDYNAGFQQAAQFYDANMDPRMERERAQVENRLRNQGLAPGMPAYDEVVNNLALQQGERRNNWMAGAQGQFFNQALQNRQQGMNELTPGVNAAGTFMQTQVSPFALMGASPNMGQLYQNYDNQRMTNYSNQLAGIGGLAGLGLKAFGGGLF